MHVMMHIGEGIHTGLEPRLNVQQKGINVKMRTWRQQYHGYILGN